MNSPFIYGKTVRSKAFTNRKEEKERLTHNMRSSINTIVISPRRWGKSSLVENVVHDLANKDKNYKFVIIDLFSINSEAEFLSLFAREILKASTTKWEDFVKTTKSIFKKIIPKISMAVGPGEVSLEFDNDEIIKHKDEILNLPENISKYKKVKFVVCIDEFQDIKTFDKSHNFEKTLRSYWQRQKNTVYCLYGSKRHMMSEIFNDSSRPFFRFGDLLMLQKIKRNEWIKYIQNSFRRTKKKISKSHADQIAERMKDHSWYVQQLAHYTWLRTKEEVNDKILERAFNEIKNTHIPFFQQVIHNLSGTQVNLLKAVLSMESKFTSTSVMEKYQLGTPNNVRKNIQTLKDKDIIDHYENGYIFLDPIIEYLFTEKVMA